MQVEVEVIIWWWAGVGVVYWWPAEWLLAALMEKKQTKPKWLSVEKEKNIIK